MVFVVSFSIHNQDSTTTANRSHTSSTSHAVARILPRLLLLRSTPMASSSQSVANENMLVHGHSNHHPNIDNAQAQARTHGAPTTPAWRFSGGATASSACNDSQMQDFPQGAIGQESVQGTSGSHLQPRSAIKIAHPSTGSAQGRSGLTGAFGAFRPPEATPGRPRGPPYLWQIRQPGDPKFSRNPLRRGKKSSEDSESDDDTPIRPGRRPTRVKRVVTDAAPGGAVSNSDKKDLASGQSRSLYHPPSAPSLPSATSATSATSVPSLPPTPSPRSLPVLPSAPSLPAPAPAPAPSAPSPPSPSPPSAPSAPSSHAPPPLPRGRKIARATPSHDGIACTSGNTNVRASGPSRRREDSAAMSVTKSRTKEKLSADRSARIQERAEISTRNAGGRTRAWNRNTGRGDFPPEGFEVLQVKVDLESRVWDDYLVPQCIPQHEVYPHIQTKFALGGGGVCRWKRCKAGYQTNFRRHVESVHLLLKFKCLRCGARLRADHWRDHNKQKHRGD
ncbi:hypothetical protein C8Q74DRAFT_767666 [Fomes fomentarius]|nr:hypothetical protein C8Q74DRAFT_767666 [Fomes fomentarius]